MWNCPKCQRPFAKPNQMHICGEKTIDELFEGVADNVVLAFDDVLVATAEWEPNLITPARNVVMFTNKRTWLIVRPLKTKLDLSFFTEKALTGPHIFKSAPDNMGKAKMRNQIRLGGPGELTDEMLSSLRKGYKFGNR